MVKEMEYAIFHGIAVASPSGPMSWPCLSSALLIIAPNGTLGTIHDTAIPESFGLPDALFQNSASLPIRFLDHHQELNLAKK